MGRSEIPFDAWLLALEIAKAEYKESWTLQTMSEEFWELQDFFSQWILEIRLNRSLTVLF